ncbi:MAG TPA: phospholipase D-like domain-containing protein [Stellaceae bacterium]|jgi:phosphatidylserine/phosphatidylglycerophosphate/cardiolipin synthase-like enzyme
MNSRWFGICLLLLLQIPGSLRAQSAPNLLPGGPWGALTEATTAEPPGSLSDANSDRAEPALGAGPLTILPNDGRKLYFQAIDAAKHEIRIEICVLEDPRILAHVEAALRRGVEVRAIVDYGKYEALASEQENLAQYLTRAGGQLHLSNPVFPRSFPKIILVDTNLLVYGSACLDQTTFMQYRDFATTSRDPQLLGELQRLFENDWAYSAAVGKQPPPFNPTPPISRNDLIISPVNGAERLVRLYQTATRTLDVYTELLGNLTLESELVAAVARGVRVRLIAPEQVNGGTPEIQQLQLDALAALAVAGVDVHVSGPDETAKLPYMHARAAVVDGKIAYLGSISLSPDSITFNREMGLILQQPSIVRALGAQFQSDYERRTRRF